MAEDKKTVDPTLAGFTKLWKGPTLKKSIMKCWLGYLGIPVTSIVFIWRVIMKIPKIGHGGRVMLFSENPLLNNDRLKR
jgi:hypothetical protein